MSIAHDVIDVPGTNVGAYLDQEGAKWSYSLREFSEAGNEVVLANGELDMTGLEVSPGQVARIAFILELEYPS